MPRVKIGSAKRQKHKKMLKRVRGNIGATHRKYRMAISARMRNERYAIQGRKDRKRDFRSLWIIRISAACRQRGLSYSRFIHLLNEKSIDINRKVLADLAVSDPAAFDQVFAQATGQAPAAPAAESAPGAGEPASSAQA